MIQSRQLIVIVAMTFGGAMTWNAFAQREKAEGDQPYTPTKLEWLALILNSSRDNDDEIQIIFRPHRERKNTIAAQVVHSPQVEDSHVQAHVTIAKRTVSRTSRQYAWDWVKVEVEVAELNTGFVP